MTHSESQDLLLDLAYGELDPVRSRELEGHLAGCEECQREKAALDEARRLTAPLREMEEPSPGFDEKILAAARTQAQIDHEGNIGQVVEVSGNVKPLGLEAARIDVHAPVSARQERRAPRWAMRVMLGGSVAAAATLALFVSTSLQSRHAQELARAAASDADAYKIRVEPVSQTPRPAQAAAPADLAQNEALREAQKTAPPPPPAMHAVQMPAKRAQKKVAVADNLEGSGGDALDQPGRAAGGVVAPVAPPEPTPSPAAKDEVARQDTALDLKEAPKPVAKAEEQPVANERRDVPGAGTKSRAVAMASPPAATVGTAVASQAQGAARPAPSGDDYRAALKLEADAQVARHAGKYAAAAAMYRQAAALRRAAGDQSDAAWDLAHAVECFAAVGMFDDGFRVRDELTNSYPSEMTAISAAKRALREVDSVPAAKQ